METLWPFYHGCRCWKPTFSNQPAPGDVRGLWTKLWLFAGAELHQLHLEWSVAWCGLRFWVQTWRIIWKWLVPLHPMVLLIIIPTQWLFFGGYTPFSDIPKWRRIGSCTGFWGPPNLDVTEKCRVWWHAGKCCETASGKLCDRYLNV